jgi:solute carrier family 10 (sodium/bile acid cotransporter), member 7
MLRHLFWIASMYRISAIFRSKFLPDNFTLALIGTLVLASLLPSRGAALEAVDYLTNVAIAALFFLHGQSCRAKP